MDSKKITNYSIVSREQNLSNLNNITWNQIGADIIGIYKHNYNGSSVSLSADGNFLAIGAPNNDDGGKHSGHVRIFKYDSGAKTWTQMGNTIEGEAVEDKSGKVSISADGNVVAIGASANDSINSATNINDNRGHVRIFKYDSGVGIWTQIGNDIDGEAAGDQSGNAVSLSSDGLIVAIAAVTNDGIGENSGHVRIYEYENKNNNWKQIGGDIDGEKAGDQSGISVSLSGDGRIVAIGARFNDGNSGSNGNNMGHVRVYQNINNKWKQIGSDIDGNSGDGLSDANSKSGESIYLSRDGSTLAIGTININNGKGYVRVFSNNSSDWTQIGSKIEGDTSGDNSGTSVSLSADGSILAIGSPFNDNNGNNAGQVRIYQYNNDVWTQIGEMLGDGNNDRFGSSVSLDDFGSTIAIGAILHPDPNKNGQVKVFRTDDLNDISGIAGDPHVLTIGGNRLEIPNEINNYKLIESNDIILNIRTRIKNNEALIKLVYCKYKNSYFLFDIDKLEILKSSNFNENFDIFILGINTKRIQSKDFLYSFILNKEVNGLLIKVKKNSLTQENSTGILLSDDVTTCIIPKLM